MPARSRVRSGLRGVDLDTGVVHIVRKFAETAIVLVQDLQAAYRGQPNNGQFRGTHVLIRDAGSWRLAGIHLSPISMPRAGRHSRSRTDRRKEVWRVGCGVNISLWVLAELDKLDAALVPEPGLRVVEVRVDRRRHRELHTRLRESVAALAGLISCGSWRRSR